MISSQQVQKDLHLESLVSSSQRDLDFQSAEINRPGLQFCGYYEHFAYERPQVIGKVEMSYLTSRSPEERIHILKQYFTYRMPCIIISRGMKAPPELLTMAAEKDIPVYLSQSTTTELCARLIQYLARELAPHITCHGVLLDVFGVGVMLSGKSGVGKSEAALELIKRGHQLVADDAVDICRVSDTRLIGTCPETIRHLMEIRGIGVIDIRAMYGISAVANSKSIDLVLELQSTADNQSGNRIDLKESTTTILGVPVSYQIVPVRPGRNLAIIVEVAARNLSLKRMGYNAALELNQRLLSRLHSDGSETNTDLQNET